RTTCIGHLAACCRPKASTSDRLCNCAGQGIAAGNNISCGCRQAHPHPCIKLGGICQGAVAQAARALAAARIDISHGEGDEHLSRQTARAAGRLRYQDRKSTRLNSSHVKISYAVFCLKKKKTIVTNM